MKLNIGSDSARSVLVAAALASERRLLILRALAGGPLTLGELHARVGKNSYRASIYRHLQKLVAAELVDHKYDARATREDRHKYVRRADHVSIDL